MGRMGVAYIRGSPCKFRGREGGGGGRISQVSHIPLSRSNATLLREREDESLQNKGEGRREEGAELEKNEDEEERKE